MIVNHRPPHGTLHAWESLELALTAAAFDQEVSIVFMGDGVCQLLANQDTGQIGIRNFAPTFRTFEDYGIRQVYAEKEALTRYGVGTDDLLIDIELIDTGALSRMMTKQDIILHF